MTGLPSALEALLHELMRLPGIGRRGAERLGLHLLGVPPDQAHALSDAIRRVKAEVTPCPECGNYAEGGGQCAVCANPHRENGILCVVEDAPDLWAFEASGSFRGRYHVLGGTLSPLDGVTADDLRIAELEERLDHGGIRELVIATNPSVDGDATAHYLAQRLAREGLTISRIAQGVPLGGHLDYADAGTLRMALEGRRQMG